MRFFHFTAFVAAAFVSVEAIEIERNDFHPEQYNTDTYS